MTSQAELSIIRKMSYAASRPPVRVLVVDDAIEIADRLASMLNELEQVEVIGPALNGAEALRIFFESSPDAVVLDLELPDHSGLEVLATMRENEDSCLIIVVTNHDGTEFRERCLRSGADHFIRKFADFEKIVDIIHRFAMNSRP